MHALHMIFAQHRRIRASEATGTSRPDARCGCSWYGGGWGGGSARGRAAYRRGTRGARRRRGCLAPRASAGRRLDPVPSSWSPRRVGGRGANDSSWNATINYKVASCSENPYARSCRSGALAKISCVKLAPNHTPLVSTHLQNANGKSTLNTPRHAASRTQQLAEHGRTLTVALARSPCADSTMPPAQVRLLPHSHAPEQPRAPAGVAHVHPVHPLLWLCPRA